MKQQKSTGSILLFVCLIVFFDAMGVGLILPLMPEIITRLSDLPNSRAVEVSGYLLVTYAGMQFVCAPLIGGLSDRFGRRPVLLLALLGFSIDYFVMAAAPSLAFLFVARLISGIFGATYSAASACIADIASKTDRARLFGIAGAAVGLGFILGPVIGGLLGSQNFRLPFMVAGLLSLTTCLFGWFNFPETLDLEQRRQFDWSRANPVGSLLSIARHPGVLILLAAMFCIQLSKQAYISVWPFFAIEVVDWTPVAIGLSITVYGIMMVIVQGLLTGPTVKWLGERTTLWLGLAFGAIGFLILAQAVGPYVIYAGIIIGGLCEFSIPTMQALMTRSAPDDSQGELQGAIASVYSAAAIIGPFIMSQIFGFYTREPNPYFPGAPFMLAAGLILSAGLIIGVSAGVRRRRMDVC